MGIEKVRKGETAATFECVLVCFDRSLLLLNSVSHLLQSNGFFSSMNHQTSHQVHLSGLANRVQNCYNRIRGVALPTAFLPCRNSPPHSRGCTTSRLLTLPKFSQDTHLHDRHDLCFNYHLSAFKENLDSIFKLIFLSCIQHLEQAAWSFVF